MDYLLKSSICLLAFYGLYFFGFRRLSFHALNRFYLLFSLALSLTIPLLSYVRTEIIVLEPQASEEVNIPFEEVQESAYNQSNAIQPTKGIEEIDFKTIEWIQILNSIYLLGFGMMIFVFTKNLLIVLYTIKKAYNSMASSETSPASLSYLKSNRRLKILITKSQSNSSFFNYVFLNPDNLNPHEEAMIIAHESFHAQRLHTLDLLILSMLKAAFWFNPIVYFYQKSLKQIHEYEVDALMSASYDSREYAHLLLKLSLAPNAMIINQFSTKPLSERIQFLFKTPTKNKKKLLYFLSLPFIAAGVMAFAHKKVVRVYQEKEEKKTVKETSESILKKGKLRTENLKKVFSDTLKKEKMVQIDSTKFTYYLSIKPTKKGNIDSFKVIIKNQLLVEGRDFIVKGEGIYLNQKYKGTRPFFHVYSTVMGPVLYPYLTKLDNIPLININLSAKLPSFFTSNDNGVISRTIKIPFPDTRPIKNQDTLRTILEANKLGKNPLVFINEEEYPSSILYRINPSNTRGSEIYSKGSQRAIEKYGLRAADGVIILNTTKNKELLLENEKQYRIAVDNVKKQLDAPKKRIQRVVLKDLDGKEYERVSIMRPDLVSTHFSVDVPVGGKVVFTVDGKAVNEENIENAKQLYIGGGCGQTHGGKYDAYIDLNTK